MTEALLVSKGVRFTHPPVAHFLDVFY